jgi:hypothetical protein
MDNLLKLHSYIVAENAIGITTWSSGIGGSSAVLSKSTKYMVDVLYRKQGPEVVVALAESRQEKVLHGVKATERLGSVALLSVDFKKGLL